MGRHRGPGPQRPRALKLPEDPLKALSGLSRTWPHCGAPSPIWDSDAACQQTPRGTTLVLPQHRHPWHAGPRSVRRGPTANARRAPPGHLPPARRAWPRGFPQEGEDKAAGKGEGSPGSGPNSLDRGEGTERHCEASHGEAEPVRGHVCGSVSGRDYTKEVQQRDTRVARPVPGGSPVEKPPNGILPPGGSQASRERRRQRPVAPKAHTGSGVRRPHE